MVVPCTVVQGERVSGTLQKSYGASANPFKPLNIVHVISSVDPAVGGPATVVVRLAAAQAAEGHNVTIVSSLAPARRSVFAAAIAGIPGIEQVKLDLSSRKVGLTHFCNPRFWKQLRSKLASSDALHLHGIWDPILLAAARIARRLAIPYVVRPCGMLDPWALKQHSVRKRTALKLCYRNMLEGAKALHVLNRDESTLISPLGLSTRHSIIPNGVFLEEMAAQTRPTFTANPRKTLENSRLLPLINGQRRYILFLSRLHHKKGLDLLAKAFIELAPRAPDVDLVVAGPDQGARGEFEALIHNAGLEQRVHVVGALYGAEKIAVMKSAACFVLPSRQEGFSLAVTEALACGVPLAISRATHFPEVAERGAGLEFDLRIDEIAGALEYLVTLSARDRAAMGAAGRKLVEARYTWPRIAAMTMNLYRQPTQKPADRGLTLKQAGRVLVPAIRAASLILLTILLAASRGIQQ